MKKIMLLALLLPVIISCKKSAVVKTPATVAPKLLPATETDTYFNYDGSGNLAGTWEEQYLYTYDSNNRMIGKVRSTTEDTNINTSTFNYDQSGNLIEAKYVNQTQTLYDYTIHYQNNLPVSAIDQNFNKTYTVSGNSLIISNTDYPYLAGDTIIFAGKNIKSEGDTQYSYGKHRGPLSAVNFKIYLGGLMPFFTENEVAETVQNNGGVYTVKYSYTYNDNGYPTKVTEVNNGMVVKIITYTYKPVN